MSFQRVYYLHLLVLQKKSNLYRAVLLRAFSSLFYFLIFDDVIIFPAQSCYTLSSFRKSNCDFLLGVWGRSHQVILSLAVTTERF